MGWILEKLDVFLAAVVIAAAAVLASQSQVFAVQYVRHAESQLADASTHLQDVQNGLRFRVMGDAVRSELETEAKAKVAHLDQAAARVRNANLFLRPIVLFRQGDPALVAATRRDFVPALPAGNGVIAFTIFGMLVGFVIYELVKLPVMALAREPRRRKFRKRG